MKKNKIAAAKKCGKGCKMADGGKIAKTLIPTVLGMINPALGAGAGALMQLIPEEEAKKPSVPASNVGYAYKDGGKLKRSYFKNGGSLNGRFTQYNAPSHSNGGQMIDSNGNPSPNAVAEIEKMENMYTLPNSTEKYIFSDSLVNPETRRTYAKDASRVMRRNKDNDPISQNTKDFSLMKLMKGNEKARAAKAAAKKYANGGPLTREEYEMVNQYSPEGFTLPDYTTVPFNNDPSVNIPTGTDPFSTMGNPLPPSLVEEVAYGTRPETILGYRDSSLNPNLAVRPFDSKAYDPKAFKKSATNTFQDVGGEPNVINNNSGSSSPTGTRGVNANNTIAAGLKGVALASELADALAKPEKEKLQLPDFRKGDEYMDNMNVDMNPLINEIERGTQAAIETNREYSRSPGQLVNRSAKAFANAAQSAAMVKMQQQQAVNQLRGAKAAREDTKAGIEEGERIRQQNVQSQNDATSRLARRKFMSDLSTLGSTLNQIEYVKQAAKNENEIANMNAAAFAKLLNVSFDQFGLNIDQNKQLKDFNQSDWENLSVVFKNSQG